MTSPDSHSGGSSMQSVDMLRYNLQRVQWHLDARITEVVAQTGWLPSVAALARAIPTLGGYFGFCHGSAAIVRQVPR
jgi:hypothetical protein